MLHLVVLTHGPDTCAAAHPEIAEIMQTGISQLPGIAASHDVSMKGMWVDPPGHVTYVLADAPNAHAVSQVMQETKVFHWNTVEIHPVIPADEAV